MTGWWFGCHFWHFPILIGNFIIPIDFHIFQRGGPTTNQMIIHDQSQFSIFFLPYPVWIGMSPPDPGVADWWCTGAATCDHVVGARHRAGDSIVAFYRRSIPRVRKSSHDMNTSITALFSIIIHILIWLVVWLPFLAFSHNNWECHHPNWRSYFSEGWPNHQPDTYIDMTLGLPPMWSLQKAWISSFHGLWLRFGTINYYRMIQTGFSSAPPTQGLSCHFVWWGLAFSSGW